MGIFVPKNANMELQADGTWKQTRPDNRVLAGISGAGSVMMADTSFKQHKHEDGSNGILPAIATSGGFIRTLPSGKTVYVNKAATTNNNPSAATASIAESAGGITYGFKENGHIDDGLSSLERRELFGEDERGNMLPMDQVNASIDGAHGGEIMSQAELEKAQRTPEEEDALEASLLAGLEHEMAKDAGDGVTKDAQAKMAEKASDAHLELEQAKMFAESKKNVEAKRAVEAKKAAEAFQANENKDVNLNALKRKLSDTELDDPGFSMFVTSPEMPAKGPVQLRREAEAAEKEAKRKRAMKGFNEREEDRKAGRPPASNNMSAYATLQAGLTPPQPTASDDDDDDEKATIAQSPKKQSSQSPNKAQATTATQAPSIQKPQLALPKKASKVDNKKVDKKAEPVVEYQSSKYQGSVYQTSLVIPRYEGLAVELYNGNDEVDKAIKDNNLDRPHLTVFTHDDYRMELAIAGVAPGQAGPTDSCYSMISWSQKSIESNPTIRVDEYSGDNVGTFIKQNRLTEMQMAVFRHPNNLVEMVVCDYPAPTTAATRPIVDYGPPRLTTAFILAPHPAQISEEKRQAIAAIYATLKEGQREQLAHTAPNDTSTVEEIQAAAEAITGRKRTMGKANVAGDQFFSFSKASPKKSASPPPPPKQSDVVEVAPSEIVSNLIAKPDRDTRAKMRAAKKEAMSPEEEASRTFNEAADGLAAPKTSTAAAASVGSENNTTHGQDEAAVSTAGPSAKSTAGKRKRVISDDEQSDDEDNSPMGKKQRSDAVSTSAPTTTGKRRRGDEKSGDDDDLPSSKRARKDKAPIDLTSNTKDAGDVIDLTEDAEDAGEVIDLTEDAEDAGPVASFTYPSMSTADLNNVLVFGADTKNVGEDEVAVKVKIEEVDELPPDDSGDSGDGNVDSTFAGLPEDPSNADEHTDEVLTESATAQTSKGKRKRDVSEEAQPDKEEDLLLSKKVCKDQDIIDLTLDDDDTEVVAPPTATATATAATGDSTNATSGTAQNTEEDEVDAIVKIEEADKLPTDTTGANVQNTGEDEVTASVDAAEANEVRRKQHIYAEKARAKTAARDAKLAGTTAQQDTTAEAPKQLHRAKKATNTKRAATKTATSTPYDDVAPAGNKSTASAPKGAKKRCRAETDEETETKAPAKKRGKKTSEQ